MHLINLIKPVQAQNPIPLAPLRGEGPLGLADQAADQGGKIFTEALSKIIGVLTVAAGLWFIIQIIIAGYGFITAGGDAQKIQENQRKIVNAVIGLAIVVLAVAFLSLIGYLLDVEFLNFGQIINNLSP